MINPAPFNATDRKLIEEICFQLTSSRPDTVARLETCIVNLLRRMRIQGTEDLREYLLIVKDSDQEFAELVSALTIHTTSWFRESPHFERLHDLARTYAEQQRAFPGSTACFSVLSAACSSGEEVYSMAMVLETIREIFPHFDYQIEGWDIDPVSIEKASLAVYDAAVIDQIPKAQQRHLRLGSERSQGFFTLSKAIRQRCRFSCHSLDAVASQEARFHIVFCRNVLIYFKAEQVDKIIRSLLRLMQPAGTLFLGHSEGIEAAKLGLKSLGHAAYQAEAIPRKPLPSETSPRLVLRPARLILIGASTGGTEALLRLLKNMPRDCPPVLVVQHIAPSFAKPFAERLAAASGLQLGTPLSGNEVKPGHLYMAWDDYHIGLRLRGGILQLETSIAPPQHSVRPAVDFLFESATRLQALSHTVGVLLTGMGRDGAEGLLHLKNAGAMTFTQDAASSVVYGMPGQAAALGASSFSGSPEQIRQQINLTLHPASSPHPKTSA